MFTVSKRDSYTITVLQRDSHIFAKRLDSKLETYAQEVSKKVRNKYYNLKAYFRDVRFGSEQTKEYQYSDFWMNKFVQNTVLNNEGNTTQISNMTLPVIFTLHFTIVSSDQSKSDNAEINWFMCQQSPAVHKTIKTLQRNKQA